MSRRVRPDLPAPTAADGMRRAAHRPRRRSPCWGLSVALRRFDMADSTHSRTVTAPASGRPAGGLSVALRRFRMASRPASIYQPTI